MGRKSRLKKEKKAHVQGDYNLGHDIKVLREGVFVGETPLSKVAEEHLDIIINNKVGTPAFREAARREMVYRVETMFMKGFEAQRNKQKLKDSIRTAYE